MFWQWIFSKDQNLSLVTCICLMSCLEVEYKIKNIITSSVCVIYVWKWQGVAVHLIQKKSYLVERSKVEGIAGAYNHSWMFQYMFYHSFVPYHTGLGKRCFQQWDDCWSECVCAEEWYFKGDWLTGLGCVHIVLLQIMAQFWKLFETSMYIDVLVQNWKIDVKPAIQTGRTVTVNATLLLVTKQ